MDAIRWHGAASSLGEAMLHGSQLNPNTRYDFVLNPTACTSCCPPPSPASLFALFIGARKRKWPSHLSIANAFQSKTCILFSCFFSSMDIFFHSFVCFAERRIGTAPYCGTRLNVLRSNFSGSILAIQV